MVGRDTYLDEHLGASLDHHGWPAEIILDGLRIRVLAQIFLQYYCVDEAEMASTGIFRQR